MPVLGGTEGNYRNPGVAAVLSFFLPGLGQIYNGSFAAAVLVFFCLGLGVIGSYFIIGIPLLIITWVCSVVGAYETALRRNRQAASSIRAETIEFDKSTFKRCPDCAEAVKAEARLCRFCGYQFVEIQRSEYEINLN